MLFSKLFNNRSRSKFFVGYGKIPISNNRPHPLHKYSLTALFFSQSLGNGLILKIILRLHNLEL